MKLSNTILTSVSLLLLGSIKAEDEEPGLVKMCLFYPNESGHARSDPILNQEAPSDHVHTFYGPRNFHPDTSYENLRATDPSDSSSPFQENQSLYWHPSIYRVTEENGETTYTRVDYLNTSPYYRWNTATSPETVEFPPGFRMIAYSNQENADSGGETGENLFMECCNTRGENEDCEFFVGGPLSFPERTCDFLGLAFAMPTCWDESAGIGSADDPTGHVAYTTDGTVSGPCPDGYDKRIPQIQLFIRIHDYKGGTYQLSDGSDVFHVDFMNGWEEGKLQDIIDNCQPEEEGEGYNPECACDELLTETEETALVVCDEDVREYIIDEATDVVTQLPRTSNSDAAMISKTWDSSTPFECVYEPPEEPEDSEGAFCFSPFSSVTVRNKGTVVMEHLELNDEVLLASAVTSADSLDSSEKYQKVLAFGHKNYYSLVDFMQIETHSNVGSPLEVTGEHLVFKSDDVNGGGIPVRADSIRVGDFIVGVNTQTLELVTKITTIQRRGIFSPLTNDGTIVVNGAKASAYTAIHNDPLYYTIGNTRVASHQHLSHIASAPLRFMCQYTTEVCQLRNPEGQLLYASVGDNLVSWLIEQKFLVQAIVVMILCISLEPLYLLEVLSFEISERFVSAAFTLALLVFPTRSIISLVVYKKGHKKSTIIEA